MAFVNPIPGKEDDMASRMRSFRNVLQTRPGLVKTLRLEGKGWEDACRGLDVDRRGCVQDCDGEHGGAGSEYTSRTAERESADYA